MIKDVHHYNYPIGHLKLTGINSANMFLLKGESIKWK